jgi:hypothetical protein
LSRTVIVMCALYFDVYLHVQSVPITSKAKTPFMARSTRLNTMW